MRAHALVIGIDKYKHAPWNLTGAVADATAFAEWVVKAGGVAPADLTLLLSPTGNAANAKRATRKAILEAFHKFKKGGAKDADRFWFFYAGHGLAPPGGDPSAGPLIVPADVDDIDFYVNEEAVGLEIFRGAMQNVAPKEQFYFVDACRDVIELGDNKILSQQLLWDVRGIDDEMLATQAVFYGTTAGRKSKEIRGHGLFGRALLAALRGLGPKLSPPAAPPSVHERLLFDQLTEFVIEAVKRGLDELTELAPEDRKGIPHASKIRVKGELAVREFAEPLPKAKVSALVDPPEARQSGRIEFLQWDDEESQWVPRKKNPAPIEPPLPEEAAFEVRGGKHLVRVSAEGFEEVVREILVYEDKRFPFELQEEVVTRGGEAFDALGFGVAEPAAAAVGGELVVSCPDTRARVAIVDGGGRELARAYRQVEKKELPAGPYKVTAELTASERVERTVVVRDGETEDVELNVATSRGAAMEKILWDLGIEVESGYAQIKGIGPVANVRLGSLLAYALRPEPRGASLRVLIGDVENSLEGCRVQIEGDPKPLKLEAVPKMPAVQGAAKRNPGTVRVRVEMPGFTPVSFPLVVLPGFVTTLIVTREAGNDIDVQQHLIPADAAKVNYGDLRFTELAWRMLEAREPLDPIEAAQVAKRFHPMLAVLEGYRMVGGEPPAVLYHLLRNFSGFPDVHVLAGLFEPAKKDEHFQRATEVGTPIVAQGFWALTEWVGAKAIAAGVPAPVLHENVLPGIAWTAFTERPRAARISDVRIVGTSGRGYVGDAEDAAVLAKAAQSVGLLEVVDGIAKSSTFLVAPNLVLVPVHVATAFAKENGDGTWTLQQKVRVRFDPADAASERMVKRVVRTLRPDDPNASGGWLDAATLAICWPVLLELDANVAAPPLKIGKAAAISQSVAVIGFPFDINFAGKTFAQQFAGASGEKHAMPGTVVRAPGATWTLDYDCFTAVGTSGAPVVDVETGTVVGMHVVGTKSEEGFKRGTAVELSRFAGALR